MMKSGIRGPREIMFARRRQLHQPKRIDREGEKQKTKCRCRRKAAHRRDHERRQADQQYRDLHDADDPPALAERQFGIEPGQIQPAATKT